MKIRIRVLSVILTACVLLTAVYYGMSGRTISQPGENSVFSANKTTIRLWYDDDSMTDYLKKEAVAYNETHRRVRMEPVLVSGLEYLENINKASVDSKDFPDLFIITNDCLEKAYLAGLATEIVNPSAALDEKTYPAAAREAVTYKKKYIAYPYYFETSSLLYNRTYLESSARDAIEAEKDAASGEAAMAELGDSGAASSDSSASATAGSSDEISQDDVNSRVQKMLPKTISDILTFAENYNAPDDVEAVFKWDVSDIFYNYFFVGNYMNLGGSAGDDPDQIDLYNEDAIRCMNVYQELNQFFAIDSDDVSYDSIMKDFIDGKIVYTVATTDALTRIRKAKEDGTCKFDFGVTTMPAINDQYKTRTMSITNCIAVNGYSEHAQEAAAVAGYLCSQKNDDMFDMTGKVPVREDVNHEDPNIDAFVHVYAQSVPMPKMVGTSNFWVQMEIAFTQIWNGADANDTLKKLSEQIMTQVTGKTYTEEKLPDPSDISLTNSTGYIDNGMNN